MQESIFSMKAEQAKKTDAPLAVRMRPTALEDIIGQEAIVGEGTLLNRLIQADKLSSVIFYGPPGSGKTTLAKVIAETTKASFYEINAVTSGKKEMAEIIEQARQNLLYGRKTILFIDEIHRFNKAQQDLLLPSVEDGLIILIGATTENPYFEINSPLLSRSTIFEFKRLGEEEIASLIERTLQDQERGLGLMDIEMDEDAKTHLARAAAGDARRALNALELASLTAERDESGKIHIDLSTAVSCIQKKAVLYDKNGDSHYDTISAFIKSIRGSDPDAGLFWLAKMLEAGEDPVFIARRLVILASEDIGNADPQALTLAVSAMQAVKMIGMPESQLILSQAVGYLATAEKSNTALTSITKAKEAVRHHSDSKVPVHLMDPHYKGARKLGHGEGYVYPHNFDENYAPQQYLPDDLKDARFYEPSSNGYEKAIRERQNRRHHPKKQKG